jgi:hypothetical protein
VQIELYYNPRDTPLAWREEVWVRGGFNRWRHKYTFGPFRMAPPGDGGEHFSVRNPPSPAPREPRAPRAAFTRQPLQLDDRRRARYD